MILDCKFNTGKYTVFSVSPIMIGILRYTYYDRKTKISAFT